MSARFAGLDIATETEHHDGPHGPYIERLSDLQVAAGNLIADPAFRHEIEALHRLGPRVTGELIVDLVRRHGPEVRARMVTFAALDPEALAALDALLWPPLPIYRVQVAA
jgi:hypothetical protein